MRYAILADIHSNLTALEAVLADLSQQGGADEIWCLGDIVGYGPDPHECLELVRSRCKLCVAGNHDLAVIGKLDISSFNPDAVKAIRWHSSQLIESETHFLADLPQKIVKGDFTLVHGSPRQPLWEYILSARQAEENLTYFNTRCCLIGHSHLPQYYQCDTTCSSGNPQEGNSFLLSASRYILNPGSVGQPRDRDPRAAYGLYDSPTATMNFQRVSYDIVSVQSRMEKVGLPRWLIERLACGQ